MAMLDRPRTLEPSADYRACLAQFPTGVAVVTTNDPAGQPVGMTINSFASVSLQPPLILWSVRRESAMLEGIRRVGHFAINILAADQLTLARRFAQRGDDRFAGVRWHPSAGASPLIDGACAWLDCHIAAEYEGGDHIILLGTVDFFERHDRQPLVFAQGQYCVVREHPAQTARNRQEDETAGASDLLLLDLLLRSSQQFSRDFDSYRRAEGVDAVQSRILGDLHRSPGTTLTTLLARNFISESAAADGLTALRARGYISGDEETGLALTAAGEQKWKAIFDGVKVFHAKRMAGIPRADLETTRRLLKTIAGEVPAPAAEPDRSS